MSNLFICSTPLQLKIAIKIIEYKKFDKKRTDIIYYFWNNDKAKVAKFINNKSNIKIIKINISQKFPYYIFFLKKKLSNLKYNNIFIASYIGRIGQIMLNIILFKNLFFFSDGSLNLFDKKMQYKLDKLAEIKYKKIIYKLTDKFFNYKSITSLKKLVTTEYTIYPIKNIKKYKYIFLKNFWEDAFGQTSSIKYKKKVKKKILKVFIGTVWKEFCKNLQIENFQNIKNRLREFLKNEKIDIYINHPRANKINFKNVKSFNIPSIAEEFILQKKINYKKIYVYGICGSTTLFNLSDIRDLKMNMVVFFQRNKYENAYIKLAKKFKIKTIKI